MMVWDEKKWKKEYAARNREKINEYHRRYYQENKVKHLAVVKKWNKDNPEKIAAYQEKMKAPAERERRKLYLQNWREKNSDKVKEYNKKWATKKRTGK